MTRDQALQLHPSDVVDLACEMADAVTDVVTALEAGTLTQDVCDRYDAMCRRVAAHDQYRSVSHLAWVFGQQRLAVTA